MGNGGLCSVFIIALILVGIFVFKGGSCSQDNFITGLFSPKETQTDTTNQAQVDSYNTNRTEPVISINACGFENFGYPDYSGTPDAGKKCSDFIQERRDLECLANPPVLYDGIISLTTTSSEPRISCCGADGTCQW